MVVQKIDRFYYNKNKMKEKKNFYLEHNILSKKLHYMYYLVFIIFSKYNDR